MDPAQTSFWEGRDFRTFLELNIAASGSLVIRVVALTDLVLQRLAVTIDGGWLKMETVVGGTPGGSFSTTLPVIPGNSMTLGADHRIYTTGPNAEGTDPCGSLGYP